MTEEERKEAMRVQWREWYKKNKESYNAKRNKKSI